MGGGPGRQNRLSSTPHGGRSSRCAPDGVGRGRENTIYFASVNYALRFQESATSLIAPSGECQAYLPYGQEGVLVQAINVEEATGLLATRYAPERYQEFTLE